MRTSGALLVGLGVLTATGPAPAADLSKVDRGIGREPAYQSKAPQYGLLVFGPKAESRVWLVVDGDVLYIDRNGNGNLTEPGEWVRCPNVEGVGPNARRWFDVGDITPRGGKKYPRLVVSHQTFPEKGKTGIHYCRVWVEGLSCQHAAARLAGRRSEAPILVFGGPLAMLPGAAHPVITDGFIRGEECEVGARVGSAGRGTSLRDGQGVVTTLFCEPFPKLKGVPPISPKSIPGDVHPVADIEFPNKDPGGKPIRLRVPLTRRC
jgi:hypothetical protein